MREILFRCWNEHGKCFHGMNELGGKLHLFNNKNPSYVVEQFTGLSDCNGVKIFEGDIVLVKATFGTSGRQPKKTGETIDVLAKVVFDSGKFTYKEPKHEYQKRIDNGNSTDWYRGYPSLEECEVIGNIHQNPELLERTHG